MWWQHKNHDRCPDRLPKNLLKGPCAAEIMCTDQDGNPVCIVVPMSTRKERRQDARAKAGELAGLSLTAVTPDYDELIEDIADALLTGGIRPVYRVRPFWQASGVADRWREFRRPQCAAERLDITDAPGCTIEGH